MGGTGNGFSLFGSDRYPLRLDMTPSNAILASLFVPGSAHVLLGKPVRGLIAFVVLVGMFFGGYAILQDRLFHAELFKPFGLIAFLFEWLPLNLLPEAPNLGPGLVAKLMHATPESAGAKDEAARMLRLARPMEHLGFWLTGSSGILACLFAADARDLAAAAPPRRTNRALAAGLSWLLPGSGHVLAGQKDKGILMGAAVVIMFAAGLAFSAGAGVDRGHHDAYWICQSMFGGGTLIAALGFGDVQIPNPIPQYYSLGYTLAAVAGLMNIVVMVDAYTVADAKPQEASGAVGADETVEASA